MIIRDGTAALISGKMRGGAVRLMGRAVGSMGVADRRRLGFAFVPEERLGRGAVPDMSLVDNVLLTAHGHGLVRRGLISRQAERAFTAEVIARFDVRTPGQRLRPGRFRAATCKSSSLAVR